ncbi:MAG: response regulator transcription factor [Ruminococcus sp.]|uniref:response regulator transcription factor n=1 Tax=Ruminococcus sp. TaxID=41978 RepID=UPI0025D37AC0|nr:response regulator transcription factor [Ruminococcus sp.]MBR0530699.1 response regulator transcription factor [Ruminococcus sp.]
MKILLVEDDQQICKVIQKYFSDRETEITSVTDGQATMQLVEHDISDYSLVLLDIMLPGTDGFTICRSIRQNSDIPVIFITAKGREEDILHGYALGCDDYIVKPFLLSALYAKCCALVKRTQQSTDTVLTCGEITLDTKKLTCCVNRQEVELTPKGFAILYYMMEHKGWVIDRDTLLNKVWGDDYFGIDRVVDNHMKRLRKALGSAGGQIHTVFGRGYKLAEK